MAFLDASHHDEFSAPFPGRHALLGLGVSTVLPVALLFAVVGVSALVGFDAAAGLVADPVAGLFFLALFPLWGAAYWLTAREGDDGRRAARWVMAVIGWGLLIPFIAALADPFFVNWAHVVTLFLMGCAAVRLAGVSRPAMVLMLPGVLWAGLAAIPAYVLLTSGWSPGFAVTLATLDRE